MMSNAIRYFESVNLNIKREIVVTADIAKDVLSVRIQKNITLRLSAHYVTFVGLE